MPDGSERVLVAMSTTHEATRRMASVLQDEGLLSEFLVPFDSSGLDGVLTKFGPLGKPFRRPLRQWAQQPRATSGAVLQEIACAIAFRLAGNRQERIRIASLVRWRVRAMDRSLRRRLERNPTDTLLVLQNFHRAAFGEAAASGTSIWLIANSDVWGLNESLSALAEEAPPGAWRDEILRELPSRAARDDAGDIAIARAVIVESPRIGNTVRAMVKPGTPILEIGQGVDPGTFVPPAIRDLSARRLRAIQVSRIAHGKGLTAANRAAGLARDSLERFRVLGWEAERAPLLARSCANLDLAGGTSHAHVVSELQAADVLVLPTLGDSMPRAVLEGMACGLPVITTHASGYDHLIRSGDNGFLVAPGDAEAIAALLARLAADGALRERIGRAARATAEANTWDALEERFRRALSGELGGRLRAGAPRPSVGDPVPADRREGA